jgi:ComF family protein
MPLARFFSALMDVVAPPRQTEVAVRSLTLKNLRTLALRGERSGSLPYHDSRVTALVWELKYYANKHAARLAGAMLKDVLIGIATESLGTPLLIPIPMHPSRRRERGHNQTEVLCEAALLHMKAFVEYAPHALVRTRATPAQQSLHKHERTHNLQGSMQVHKKSNIDKVAGRVCIVVDDVCTTGATFAEATRALKSAGAAHVECVALAYS